MQSPSSLFRWLSHLHVKQSIKMNLFQTAPKMLKEVCRSQIAIVGSGSDGSNERDDADGRIFHGRLARLQVGCQEDRASFQELLCALSPTLLKGQTSEHGTVPSQRSQHFYHPSARFIILSIPDGKLSELSPFAVEKALKGIGGSPKSVKKLRSDDLLIETTSALQTKSFLQAKSFLNHSVSVTLRRTLNSCCGVIFEKELFNSPESEILDGLASQGVLAVKRIFMKKENALVATNNFETLQDSEARGEHKLVVVRNTATDNLQR
ncbi:hypothetical protein HNY73_009833 [Argiope bruennichi]|uniref:Uncharacterized protein n=1 Tax=Argiope bruennichi TaxID=94029 RepID=A0A8T0FD71_ARGBR|nr:hypothetical protein HNY73_009833 [Argiope bruennichi]